MKWRLSLLLLVLLALTIFPIAHGIVFKYGYGGGGANYFKYSQTIVIQPSTTQIVQQTETGSTWDSLSWLNPTYVSVVNTNQLQVLPDEEYIDNNASFTTNNANIAINVTVEVASTANRILHTVVSQSVTA